MERGRRPPFKKRSRAQYDSRESNGRSKRHSSILEAAPKANDTVYRILCPDKKIGGVIGKGGSIINALREETRAKIRVVDGFPGGDERVIIIFSPPTRKPTQNTNEDSNDDGLSEKEHDLMQPHCPAQDALLKIHDRIIVEEDKYGNVIHEADENEDVVTARLLVPGTQVGCLLGKGGNIIQKLRADTGATIRIMPSEHRPAGAMKTDELVQISGTSTVAMKALYEVSTLLHQNPRKENIPLNYPGPGDAHGFYQPGSQIPPPGNPMWSHQHPGPRGPPPMPWFGGYGNEAPGMAPAGFNGGPPRNAREPAEFYMKILCSAERTGAVIGKGGTHVKQLEKETGTNIHVDSTIFDSEERVITVSATEDPWDQWSPTIQAILQLQNRASEVSEKGLVVTRLLVPSSKVGCILGEGGHVITEMRRRTQADIRVYSKSDKPKCASADEELVQISGKKSVAKDALMEIASRLRERSLRGVVAAANPGPPGPFQGYSTPQGFSRKGPFPSGVIGASSSGGYDNFKGTAEGHGYPIQSTHTGYPNMNNSVEVKIPNSAIASVLGMGGSNISNIRQISGARVKLQDPLSGASECVVEIHGSSEQMNAAQSLLHAFIASGDAQQAANPAVLT